MRIVITGGSGYVGGPVVRALAAEHEVVALVRSEAKAAAVAALGALPLLADLTEVPEADVIVHLAPVDVGPLLGRGHLIYTSVLFVLGNVADADERTPPNPPPYAAARREQEERVLAAGGAVIRPGMVYGGGNGGSVSELFRSAHEEGRAAYVGDGGNRWTLVHREDVAALFLHVVNERGSGVYHAVDEHPLTVAEVASAASLAAGRGGATVSLPLDEARQTLGAFADALCLDQVVRSTRWRTSRRSFLDEAENAFGEWLT
jgi:nucleoside-diphosphate-sugar epimerase